MLLDNQPELLFRDSNQIFDPGVATIELFARYLSAYNKARHVIQSKLPGYEVQRDLIDPYNEQRNIPFAVWVDLVDRVATANQLLSDFSSARYGNLSQQHEDVWRGNGGAEALASWRVLANETSTLQVSLAELARDISLCISSIARYCQEKTSWVARYLSPQWPIGDSLGLSPADIERLVRIVLDGAPDEQDVRRFSELSASVNEDLAHRSCVLSARPKDLMISWAKETLTQFCSFFDIQIRHYRAMCHGITVAVDQTWSLLADSFASRFNAAQRKTTCSTAFAPGTYYPTKLAGSGLPELSALGLSGWDFSHLPSDKDRDELDRTPENLTTAGLFEAAPVPESMHTVLAEGALELSAITTDVPSGVGSERVSGSKADAVASPSTSDESVVSGNSSAFSSIAIPLNPVEDLLGSAEPVKDIRHEGLKSVSALRLAEQLENDHPKIQLTSPSGTTLLGDISSATIECGPDIVAGDVVSPGLAGSTSSIGLGSITHISLNGASSPEENRERHVYQTAETPPDTRSAGGCIWGASNETGKPTVSYER